MDTWTLSDTRTTWPKKGTLLYDTWIARPDKWTLFRIQEHSSGYRNSMVGHRDTLLNTGIAWLDTGTHCQIQEKSDGYIPTILFTMTPGNKIKEINYRGISGC